MNTNTSLPADPEAAPATAARVRAFAEVLAVKLATSPLGPTREACLRAAASACRRELERRWVATQADDRRRLDAGTARRVHYLSMEFLMGRALGNALAALGLDATLREMLVSMGRDPASVLELEHDAALGNGGLGRLAACFLDSFAEVKIPAFGYGLRYRYGMFAQAVQDGNQVEVPDEWMRNGNPWDVPRPEVSYKVGFGGRVVDEAGSRRWIPAERLRADAFDFIVPAHQHAGVSTLRQWQASSEMPIDFAAFSHGDLHQAAHHQVEADALNWVLYPDDSTDAGRQLRLKQEAFLVSASLQDTLARHRREHGSLHDFGRRNAIHLNDTHPALAPAELMRLLVDEHGMHWNEAWRITRETVSYTNHTLMPEALETWPLRMFEQWLPRHLEIIFEINRRFLAEVRERFPGDEAMVARASLIDEAGERRVRMAALAIVASHKVNGVSALHSDLMVRTIFSDYARLWPERFCNVTNGVTPRRWLMQANPALSSLLDGRIGRGWRADLDQLEALRPLADDPAFGLALMAAKRSNKRRLAALIQRELGIAVDPDSLFDVQAKRIHEYKRQLLNLLHVVARYQWLLANPDAPVVPRTVILAGKAASAYYSAKQIIRLAHDIARTINADARIGGKLKLVFLPNYGVSLAEVIVPAADLSEQISTAGTEASGTGNMKFAMNGALTIGTWDGANIEMAQAMGVENMFVFGLRTEQVREVKALGYDPGLHAEESPALAAVLSAIGDGAFSPGDDGRYRGMVDELLQRDHYLLLADFADYLRAQAEVDALYADPDAWARRAALNIAGMGRFSADRTVAEYRDAIWAVPAPH